MVALQITTMDPAMRSLWLSSYKEMVNARYEFDKTIYAGPFSDEEKETSDILEEVIKIVEKNIYKKNDMKANHIITI